MDTISDIFIVPTQGAYYYEDVSRLQETEIKEDDRWTAKAKTPGFSSVREIAEVVSVGILSSSGVVSWGDCVGVSYSGKSGRDGVFRHKEGVAALSALKPLLLGKPLAMFRSFIPVLESFSAHKAIHYGVSQALLSAVADNKKETITQAICREWNLPLPKQMVPIQGSSGNNRNTNADKMIVNRIEALPHAQIDTISTQLGLQGEILLEYASWLKNRISTLGGANYHPTVDLDVHGAVGKIFSNSPQKVAQYLVALEKAVAPYPLRMESVMLGNSKEETILLLGKLKAELKSLHSSVKITADEWANTKAEIIEFAKSGSADMIHLKMPDLGGVQESIDTVLELKRLGVACLLGGSCIETEISSKISAHIALATQPSAFLAKPGMGIDEAIMLCRNEMRRVLAVL